MTRQDVWFGLSMTVAAGICSWLIQGVWLGVGNPTQWALQAVVFGVATLSVRVMLRAFGADHQKPR
jgi:hypothetical protein